jgi:hypothetical protein
MFQFSLAIIGFVVGLTILASRKKAIRSNQNHDTPALGQAESAKSNYEAPLTDPDPHLRRIPQSYWVIFHPGHTWIAHSVATVADIEPHIRFIFSFGKDGIEGGRVDGGIVIKPFTEIDYPPKDISIHYDGRDIDDNLLAAIRSDPGVKTVEYIHYIKKEANGS